ncbi:MAG: RNA-binding cell elongation regulator Jag/EloR [Pseudomonadota bacterium]
METYEFEGKSTEEAIENASKELALPVEELNIDIIEQGSSGIFGLVGTKKAKIKVTVNSSGKSVEENGLLLAKEALEKILSLIPVDATVRAEEIDHAILLNIEGDKSGLLIGRKGKTLDALQFIVNKIVNKAFEKKIRVIVDSENYRQRRRESLVQLALRMGDKAKRIRKPVTTNPLNPRERRIVHLALKEDGSLETRSRGEGPLKKVMIIPIK